MGVSNTITAVLNFESLLGSVLVIWLASEQYNECVRLARWPVIILGVLLLLFSLAGFVGAYWYEQGLLAAYSHLLTTFAYCKFGLWKGIFALIALPFFLCQVVAGATLSKQQGSSF